MIISIAMSGTGAENARSAKPRASHASAPKTGAVCAPYPALRSGDGEVAFGRLQSLYTHQLNVVASNCTPLASAVGAGAARRAGTAAAHPAWPSRAPPTAARAPGRRIPYAEVVLPHDAANRRPTRRIAAMLQTTIGSDCRPSRWPTHSCHNSL